MAKEYIEREALLTDFDLCNNQHSKWTPQRVKTLIVRANAADVAPVVHSKWKYYHKQGKAVCMNCSFERGVDDNFGRAVACPNCGARMGGE